MSHTFTRLLYHVVFSTRGRCAWIDRDSKSALFAYMGGIVKKRGGHLIAAGGVADHVHLVICLPPDAVLSDVVRYIKGVSSKWRNLQRRCGPRFAWQSGYGAFTVSESQLQRLITYTENQETHHLHQSSSVEFTTLLTNHNIPRHPPA